MCHQNSANELGSARGFALFQKGSQGSVEAAAPRLHQQENPLPTGLLTLCLSSLCVRQLSQGLQAVRIEDPAPKRCLNTRFSSPPHTLPPSCRNQAASSTENLSLPAGEPGEDHHTLLKQLEFTVRRELHCFLCSNNSLPHGSSLGSSQSMA